MTAILSLALARADNGVIGRAGGLPWRIPDDMRRFKALTLGKPCIMGRKTWDSLPRKPLPGRTNIVVTRDESFRAEDAVVVRSLDDAIAQAEQENSEEIMVIGGAEIYRAALPLANRIHLTEVHGAFDGDVVMPPFDAAEWMEVAREDRPATEADGPSYSFVTLERTVIPPFRRAKS
jgi:dihydrofolate reductase